MASPYVYHPNNPYQLPPPQQHMMHSPYAVPVAHVNPNLQPSAPPVVVVAPPPATMEVMHIEEHHTAPPKGRLGKEKKRERSRKNQDNCYCDCGPCYIYNPTPDYYGENDATVELVIVATVALVIAVEDAASVTADAAQIAVQASLTFGEIAVQACLKRLASVLHVTAAAVTSVTVETATAVTADIVIAETAEIVTAETVEIATAEAATA
eukprot:CAMPEP_0168561470 /NCGR_PEP_ID=MMETSP0413-20121227/11612_1 /TAXON_ID=136452 /ORGANISM="Filamoeba nolandi, Strain NC-AS-23-1" /LENGTH=209 /DNA_ID=CAMNT_0008592843 /DNA_START=71 /DNA_END=698 /DNA_ORIENTATION=+